MTQRSGLPKRVGEQARQLTEERGALGAGGSGDVRQHLTERHAGSLRSRSGPHGLALPALAPRGDAARLR